MANWSVVTAIKAQATVGTSCSHSNKKQEAHKPKKKLDWVRKDRPTGIKLRRRLGFPN